MNPHFISAGSLHGCQKINWAGKSVNLKWIQSKESFKIKISIITFSEKHFFPPQVCVPVLWQYLERTYHKSNSKSIGFSSKQFALGGNKVTDYKFKRKQKTPMVCGQKQLTHRDTEDGLFSCWERTPWPCHNCLTWIFLDDSLCHCCVVVNSCWWASPRRVTYSAQLQVLSSIISIIYSTKWIAN
jgi:hypothetical protein